MLFIERVHTLCMYMYNVQCMHPLNKKKKKIGTDPPTG